jgi:hypothetical protein
VRARGRERSVGDVESRGRLSGRNTCRRWCDSDAPELTEDVEPGPSGGDFRSTCGIGIGGTNLSSLCATGIANGAKKPDAGFGTGGAARAWPDNAASASKQRQNLMAGNAITPTISAPARDDMAAPLLAIVTIYGAI